MWVLGPLAHLSSCNFLRAQLPHFTPSSLSTLLLQLEVLKTNTTCTTTFQVQLVVVLTTRLSFRCSERLTNLLSRRRKRMRRKKGRKVPLQCILLVVGAISTRLVLSSSYIKLRCSTISARVDWPLLQRRQVKRTQTHRHRQTVTVGQQRSN